MPVLTHTQETAIEAALSTLVAQQLIDLLNVAQGPTSPVPPP